MLAVVAGTGDPNADITVVFTTAVSREDLCEQDVGVHVQSYLPASFQANIAITTFKFDFKGPGRPWPWPWPKLL
jgi:hypothetical protein